VRRELGRTAGDLERALDALDDRSWRAEVRSALGRIIPAAEIPWMRVREVWLHAVDLDAGARLDDLPAEVIDTLLDDVTLRSRPATAARPSAWNPPTATATGSSVRAGARRRGQQPPDCSAG
jgi:maleylpyruvate isomerase